LTCKRKHGKWFQEKRVGKDKLHCSYIMGYKMKGDQGNRTVECGDLPINDQLPVGYISLAGVEGIV